MTDLALSADDARTLTDQIKVAVEGTWHLVTQAYTSRAWAALGYASWDDYTTREFGTSRLRLPREERQDVVASLRESGLSLRAIAAVTGDSPRTIRRTLESGGANATPDIEPVALIDEWELDVEMDDVPEVLDAVDADTVTRHDSLTFEPIEMSPERRAVIESLRSPKVITGTDGKRYTVPPRPAPVAQIDQAERERQKRLQYRKSCLIDFLNGWIEFENFTTLSERADVLDLMAPSDRQRLLDIERSLGWTTAA